MAALCLIVKIWLR